MPMLDGIIAISHRKIPKRGLQEKYSVAGCPILFLGRGDSWKINLLKKIPLAQSRDLNFII